MAEPEEMKDHSAGAVDSEQEAATSDKPATEDAEAPDAGEVFDVSSAAPATAAVDALAAMAGGQEPAAPDEQAAEGAGTPDTFEALDVLATGQAFPSAPAAVDALAALANGQESGMPDGQAAGGFEVPPSQRTVEDDAARKARASALMKQSRYIHAEQFKRIMVPLLTVTGILLLVLGSVVATMNSGEQPSLVGQGFLYDRTVQKALVIAAFPLGAILLVGAWFFRTDLKRAGNRKERN
ncbi:MAG: hypothetical protein QF577_04220 [Phycisphaerae bacterium]|jgi:hypothetical protein|nr:hypothetical protein [Phycisphaerae bacterium]